MQKKREMPLKKNILPMIKMKIQAGHNKKCNGNKKKYPRESKRHQKQ